MRNRKILFLDLDDTLLSKDKTISAGNARAIHEMLLQGHYVAINTGRPVESCKILTRDLKLNREHCYMLPFQGSILYDCSQDEIKMRSPMKSEDAIGLMAELEKQGIYCQTFSEDTLFTLHDCQELHQYNSKALERVHLLGSLEELKEQSLYKVMAIDYKNRSRLLSFGQEYLPQQQGRFDSFFSSPYFLEYCKAGANKGSGLEYLASYLDVPIAQTIAVGDEQNDIPMIKAAGIGVCMKNGIEEAKQCADYVTEKDNNHDAIQEVIGKFIL